VDVIDTPETHDLIRQVALETYAVATAKGMKLRADLIDSMMANFEAEKHEMVSSMHLDLKAGNPLEVGVINGAVWRNGRDIGVDTPLNELITRCLAPADKMARARMGLQEA
jgi:2-dehydropantoate 2-reductase